MSCRSRPLHTIRNAIQNAALIRAMYCYRAAKEPLLHAPLIVAPCDATRFRMRSCHEDASRKSMFRGARLANSKSKCPASEPRRVPVQRHRGQSVAGHQASQDNMREDMQDTTRDEAWDEAW